MGTKPASRWVSCLSGMAALLVSVVAAGCGGQPSGIITGKVTYQDKPIPGGVVIFATDDYKSVVRADTDENGNYTAKAVPVGPMNVTVEIPSTKVYGPVFGAGSKVPKKMPNVPEGQKMPDFAGGKGGSNKNIPAVPEKTREKYADPKTSGLKYDVKAGDQVFNIPVK